MLSNLCSFLLRDTRKTLSFFLHFDFLSFPFFAITAVTFGRLFG